MPWDWERLTDKQIELIFDAEIKRAKRAEGNDGVPAGDGIPTEDEFVAAWRRYGGSEADIRAEYRRCMREDAQRADR